MSHRANLPWTPAALRREHAAAYVGMSANTFTALIRDGLMPAPRLAGGVKIWLRADLDAALAALPAEDGAAMGGDECDAAFGLR